MTAYAPPQIPSDDPKRYSYVSNLSSYSGVVSDAVPVSFSSKPDLSIVPAQEVFHTPLSSPVTEKPVDNEIQAGYPKFIPFLKLKKAPPKDLPLDSPPKDITTVSNYESSIDSGDAEAIINSRLHYKESRTDPISTKVINNHPVVIEQGQPVASVNGSISVGSEHLNSLTSHSTDHSFPVSNIQVSNIVTDTIIEDMPGSYVNNQGPHKIEKVNEKNFINEPKRQDDSKTQNYRKSQDLRMASNVPAKNVTMTSYGNHQNYYSTSNSHYGTGAYNNSFIAGETLKSPKESSKRNSFQSQMSFGPPPNNGVRNRVLLKDHDLTPPLSPAEDFDIPPRSPDRPSPSTDRFREEDNKPAPITKDSKVNLTVTSDFDSVSFTSLDNKTLLNTIRNSDLRSIDEERKIAESRKNSVETEPLPVSPTDTLNHEFRPPVENSMIQQDLDLTDDEQITSLINEMKLRSSSVNPYNRSNRYSSSKSFGEFMDNGFSHSSFVPQDVSIVDTSSIRTDPKLENSLSFAKPVDSDISVREKTQTSEYGMEDKENQKSNTNSNNIAAIAAAAATDFVKNSLNYHHKRYKSDSLDDGADTVANSSRKTSTTRKSSVVTTDRKSSILSSSATTTRNNSIQAEKPLIIKKRSNHNVRPLPVPPEDPKEAFDNTEIEEIARLRAPTAPVSQTLNEHTSIEDITAEVDKEISERVHNTTAENDEDFVDITNDSIDMSEVHAQDRSSHHHHHHRRHRKSSKKQKKKSLTKSLDTESIARLLDATEGTVIGQEFKDLELPSGEKRMLERIVDALSRLTADMISDPARYNEGMKRLGTALRALEGFE